MDPCSLEKKRMNICSNEMDQQRGESNACAIPRGLRSVRFRATPTHQSVIP